MTKREFFAWLRTTKGPRKVYWNAVGFIGTRFEILCRIGRDTATGRGDYLLAYTLDFSAAETLTEKYARWLAELERKEVQGGN